MNEGETFFVCVRFAINVTTCNELWSFNNYTASAVVRGDVLILIASPNADYHSLSLNAYDAHSGQFKWAGLSFLDTTSPTILAPQGTELLYTVTERILSAVNGSSGNVVWNFSVPLPNRLSPYECYAVDGVVSVVSCSQLSCSTLNGFSYNWNAIVADQLLQ